MTVPSGQRPSRLAYVLPFALATVLLTAHSLSAQTASLANITGIVTDESGGVLPGVTVTASSPNLQVKQVSAVTEASGEYRLSGLPLGTYEVVYSLDGFQSIRRQDVRLTAGFTARLDITLKVGALNETITVSGASPVIDVVSTTPTTALTRETLELIPTSRNGVQALLTQAPGTRTNLDVGGNTAGAIPQFRAFGQSNGSWPVVEGVPVAQPSNSSGAQSGVYLDYSGLEEAQVSSVGNDSETPTRGIQLSMLVKSGGNAYHGGLVGSYTNSSLISNNIDARLAAQGLRGLPIQRRWDFGGDIGGYAKRDRVWYYLGARQRVNDNGVLDCLKPDGSACETLLSQRFYNSKVTYQINPKQRLIGYYQWNLKRNITGASALIDWGSRFDQQFTGNVGKAEWQGTLKPNVLANALVGFWNFNSWQYGFDTGPSSQDIVRLTRWGSSSQSYFTPIGYIWTKYNVKAAVSWYTADSFFGDHNVKGGLDFIAGNTNIQSPEHTNGNYQLLYSNGAPFQVQAFNFPVDVRNTDHYYGFFVKDEWRMSKRLTLSLGARLALDRGFIPEQSHDAGQFSSLYPAATYSRIDVTAWDTFVPRLHAAYDVTGDGKTVIKGGWGRFAAIRGADDANYVNRNVIASTTFRWRDLNGNRNFDLGETNLDPNGPDFVSQTGTTQGILNRSEKPPISDEFSLSVERQLVPNVAVRATGIYSKDTNNAFVINPLIPFEAYTVPVTGRDPGPDGVLGSADDTGQTFTYYEFPTSMHGTAFQATTRVNAPELDATYKSFELALSRRFVNRWQAMASFSFTRLQAPGLNVAGAVATPNTRFLGDNNTREWSAKASGAYQLPLDVLASVNYELRSGAPWQRTVLFRGGIEIPTIVLPVEPLGARYYDNIHLLDARARKEFRYRTHRVALGVDIFNLLNVNTVTSITTRSGPNFGLVTTAPGNTATLPFIPGRNVQFTLNYTF